MNNSRIYEEGLDLRSRVLRRTIVEILGKAGRGHPGSSMSVLEIMRVLYDDIVRVKPSQPDWADRDRVILSKGHGCLALYVMLADKGFFPEEELWKFCKQDGILGGHPEYGKVPGVEASTGSLGHGLSIGVGFSLNSRMAKHKYRVFVVMGDGESNEGSVWEAALSAAKYKLENLTVIIDYNKLQSYGAVQDVQPLEPLIDKWRAFGFGVAEVDGHDVEELRAALTGMPTVQGRPSALICHTVKGKGFSFMENNLSWHHKSKISEEEFAAMVLELKLDTD